MAKFKELTKNNMNVVGWVERAFFVKKNLVTFLFRNSSKRVVKSSVNQMTRNALKLSENFSELILKR